MANTQNYNLKKLEYTEIADIPAHFNGNMDIIDNVLKVHDDALVTNLQSAKNYTDQQVNTVNQALAAHLAETVITANKTINVPGDFATIQEALDSLKKAWIPRDVTVTIRVAGGVYNHFSPIIVDHPQGQRIKIIGATPVTTSITGNGAVTGSAGNWNVQIKVQSTAGISAGDYVIIRDTTGIGDHYAFRGIWKVISVDSGTQITVQNTHRKSTFPSATLTGGSVVALKTILKFINSTGLYVGINSALGLIDNIAIVGDGNGIYNIGVVAGRMKDGETWYGGPAFLRCGENFGVNGFSFSGISATYGGYIIANKVAVSGNKKAGFEIANSSYIEANYAISSGNEMGFYAGNGGFTVAGYSIASGNESYGFCSDAGGCILAGYSIASGNKRNGYECIHNGTLWADYSQSIGNDIWGYNAWGSSWISAGGSKGEGNGFGDYCAVLSSAIYVQNYQGNPTFSPALNTVGNGNAIIST